MSPLVFGPDMGAWDQDAFLKDLAELCPTSSFKVDGAGAITFDGDPGCASYCDHPVACNLLRCVLLPIPGNPPVTIRWSKPRYIPNCPTIPNAYTLWWNPGAKLTDLAHELIHVCRDYEKTLKCADNSAEESCTSCGENQIRDELGLPPRKYYFKTNSGDPILLDCEDLSSYGGCLPLSDADELGCACGSGIKIGPFTLPSDKVMGWIDKAWEKIKEILGPKIPIPRPGPEARRAREDFRVVIEGADANLGRVLVSADAMRRRFRGQHRLQPMLEDLLRNAHSAIIVESVRHLEPSYTIMAMVDTEEGPRLLSNVSIGVRPGAFVGPAGPPEQYALADGFGVRIQEVANGMVAAGGRAGGIPEVLDGGTKFLTVVGPEGTTRAALYGYFYQGFDPSDERDLVREDDQQAWLAIRDSVQLWRESVDQIDRAV